MTPIPNYGLAGPANAPDAGTANTKPAPIEPNATPAGAVVADASGVTGRRDGSPIPNGSPPSAEPHDGTIEQTTGAAVGGVSASIPDDVWAAATVAYELYRADRQKPLLWHFASAIMAERERCAMIAERMRLSDDGRIYGTATLIAKSIRKGA